MFRFLIATSTFALSADITSRRRFASDNSDFNFSISDLVSLRMLMMLVSICFVAFTLSSLSSTTCEANFALSLRGSAYSRFIRSEESMSKRPILYGSIFESDNGGDKTSLDSDEMGIWPETNCSII